MSTDILSQSLPILPESIEVQKSGLVIPENTSFEIAEKAMEYFKKVDGVSNWAKGDLLNFSESHHGEMYSQLLDEGRDTYQHLRNCKWVSGKFELSVRTDKPYSYHEAAASLDIDIALELINKATSHKELREMVRSYSHEITRLEAPPLPVDKFEIIYADPPWRYEFSRSDSRQIENQYPTMELDEMMDMDIPAADDCVLFMWATSPKLAESIELIESWGFEYKTCAVWDKQKIGMGYYFRQQHELLLVAAKGALPVSEPSDRVSSVISIPRGKHSAKPHEFYDLINEMYPNRKKIELFCRTPQDGWESWGNQCEIS